MTINFFPCKKSPKINNKEEFDNLKKKKEKKQANEKYFIEALENKFILFKIAANENKMETNKILLEEYHQYSISENNKITHKEGHIVEKSKDKDSEWISISYKQYSEIIKGYNVMIFHPLKISNHDNFFIKNLEITYGVGLPSQNNEIKNKLTN